MTSVRCGLYGKLPAKRDFVAVATPRDFLSAWEPWMQGGLSASRAALGTGWQAAYLKAPIWRFWLGADICGASVIGAFMPSVDGIGRYFPLTLFARAEPGDRLPPPEIDGCEAWLGEAEELLLSTLSEADFDRLAATIAGMAGPASAAPSALPGDAIRTRDGSLVGGGDLGDTLAAFRAFEAASVHSAMSYWWTLGGEDFDERVVASRRMPDPYVFAGMLNGQFDARAA